jgi:hypothetical protein
MAFIVVFKSAPSWYTKVLKGVLSRGMGKRNTRGGRKEQRREVVKKTYQQST